MARRRYGDNTFRIESPVKTANLRYPIALLKAKVTPNQTDETWYLKVKPYATPFADFDEGTTRPARGDEQEAEAIHIFMIRLDPTLPIETGDFVVHEETLYTIQSLKKHRGRREFLEIKTTVFSKVATSGVTVDNTISVTPVTPAGNNPFFTD